MPLGSSRLPALLVLGFLISGCAKPETDHKGRLTGTVTLDGNPLAGAQVDLHVWDAAPNKGAVAGGITDSDGNYEIKVPPGRYRIEVYRSKRIAKPGSENIPIPPKGLGKKEKPVVNDRPTGPSLELQSGEHQTKNFDLK